LTVLHGGNPHVSSSGKSKNHRERTRNKISAQMKHGNGLTNFLLRVALCSIRGSYKYDKTISATPSIVLTVVFVFFALFRGLFLPFTGNWHLPLRVRRRKESSRGRQFGFPGRTAEIERNNIPGRGGIRRRCQAKNLKSLRRITQAANNCEQHHRDRQKRVSGDTVGNCKTIADTKH